MRFFRMLVLFLCSMGLMAGDAYVRHPAPSPDGSKIAFSYRGDIWVSETDGASGIRLTVHPAYDSDPIWSPDGNWIAFSSRRFGNMDVFVIPSDGGMAKRLTWHSADDIVSDFSPDGKQVLFYARYRGDHYYRDPMLYTISVTGGTPAPVFPDFATYAKYSPDGLSLAYVDHNPPWWRKDYRGPSNMDIRLFNLKAGTFSKKLTTFQGNDYCPMWAGNGSMYFLSDRDGFVNVWKMTADGSAKTQITRIKEKNIAFANISADGTLIAFELNGRLYTVSTADNNMREIQVQAPSDVTENDSKIMELTKNASEMQVSPDGKQIAFVVYGDVFVMKTKKGKARNLTENNFREKDLTWSPDGKYLYFSSDRAGNYDIFRISPTDELPMYRSLHRKLDRITDNEAEEYGSTLSPDGKTLAFVRGNGKLVLSDPDGKNPRTLLDQWNTPEFSFSPDSRYIAYSISDNSFNTDIFIQPVSGGKAVNITLHPDEDGSPLWTADGKMLYFLSHRSNYSNDVWYVYLTKADEQMTAEEREEAADSEKAAAKKDKEKEDTAVTVKIDFDDISKRVHKLTHLEGNEGAFAVNKDGTEIIFTANISGTRSLWKIKRDGSEMKELPGTKGVADISWNKKTGNYYFRTSTGSLKSVTFKEKTEGYAYSARLHTSRAMLFHQMYLECWRIMNNYFYDPDFHGADWQAVKAKYEPLAAKAASRDDFYDVIREMIGELNGSHLGIYPPRGQRHRTTGELGILKDYSYEGDGVRVQKVLKESPASFEKSRLYSGDIIESVNGSPVSRETNFYAPLFDTTGQRILLSVKGKDGKTRKVTIEPASARKNLTFLYNDWVERNRKLVDSYSDGKLGYVHIRGMDQPSYDRFQQEVYSEADGKDGLVIDVRNNGGGWTTDILLRIIGQKEHAITIPRDGGKGYPDMERKQVFLWTRPIVVTCNEGSYSNAEIFSHAVKTLGIAKVVGMPTFGAVISTGGTSLIDGSYFRIPFRGWYVSSTGKDMENGPAIPDYIVATER
ncbi:MAG: PD40 domain-containing protein, partial [Holophagae bacterium]|nr:PD40 domain-containing protein [Holophagae bacterium]